MVVLNLIGIIEKTGEPLKFVLRGSQGLIHIFTPLDLINNEYKAGNFTVSTVNNKLSIKCRHCRLSDLPRYDSLGRLISSPKVTVLYALTSNTKREGFALMLADGSIVRKLYPDALNMVLQYGATNATVSSTGILKPKYKAFEDRKF
jgi:hypothetical protein